MPSRLMPLALIALTAVAFMWMTRNPNSPKEVDQLPVLEAAEILELGKGSKLLLLNFWATWCEPCAKEIPTLVGLAGKWGPKGLKVVLVNLEDPEYALKSHDFLNRYQATSFGVIRAEQEDFFKNLGLEAPSALPFTALISTENGTVSSWLGEKSPSELELEVKALLK